MAGRESNRSQRVADFLQQELARLIQQEVRDPRIGMVDVTGVEVTRDLGHARVFVTFMNAEQEEAVEALNKASGYLRTLLAKGNKMRTTPSLRFIYDESVRRGSYLTNLIDEVVAKDKARHDGEESE
jgi:ribosome-binding factor A